MTPKLYRFRQNNSGGSFHFDKNVCKVVYIQAHSHYEANEIAEEIGIYFNGCSSGMDCWCCGDRWWPASQNSGIENKESLIEELRWDLEPGWDIRNKDEPVAIFHTLDGYRHKIFRDGSIKSYSRNRITVVEPVLLEVNLSTIHSLLS